MQPEVCTPIFLDGLQIIPFDLPPICPYNRTMRDWSLGPGDPLMLSLAADSRLSPPDYLNDHIWELELGGGEPAALSLRTTYGLRARAMRMFLRFTENGQSVTDPLAFSSGPRLKRFYPNFLWLEFAPFEDLNTSVEFWVPESTTLAGRLTLANRSTVTRQVRLEVCAALAHLDGQNVMPIQQQMVNVLAGGTGGLFPVLFMTGGPKPGPGPHPSLALDLELGPGATRQVTFAQAARETLPAAFELARHTAARQWEAERARIELTNQADTCEIYTGDVEWDAALAFSQSAALGLLLRGNEHLPYTSFISARQPDHGFSRKGDGTDYPPSWSGQSPLEASYLASLLPGLPRVGRDFLLNFLSTQGGNGEVDNKPGLAGQRGKLLAAPILSSLAWTLHRADPDLAFLEQAFPKLQKFFWSWFSPDHDLQRDGIPEWAHLLQTGFEDNPLFDVWHPWSMGVSISTVHSPALCAMLYREARCLIRMAGVLGSVDDLSLLELQAGALQKIVKESWNASSAIYCYTDRDTHLSLPGKVLARGKEGAGSFRPKAEFEQPVRLQIEIRTKSHTSKRPEAEIGEYAIKGEPEIIGGHRFQWQSGGLAATSEKVYTRVGRVKVRGLDPKDKVIIRTVDLTFEDLTLLLPLWAGMSDPQHAQALIGRTILAAERFDRPFGLPALPDLPTPEADSVGMSVHLPWNHLIGEGLLAYGFRDEAARLTAHLMNGIIQNLKQMRAFYQRYHAERGTGIGERNSLNGLAPVGLFLHVLGVTILSPTRVRLEGRNPYPWPVTVKYRGLIVVRNLDHTAVTFPNGTSIHVTETAPVVVSA